MSTSLDHYHFNTRFVATISWNLVLQHATYLKIATEN